MNVSDIHAYLNFLKMYLKFQRYVDIYTHKKNLPGIYSKSITKNPNNPMV